MSPPKPQRHLAADRPPSSACHNPPPGLLNLRRRWDPPKELSESDAKEIIQELESRNGTQLDEHVVPLCLLAFLQKNPQLLELSALSVDQAVKEEEFIDETLNPLETRGMIDLFEEDRGSGDEGHKKHYIAMPDEELKKQLISWTFNCDKRLTGTALGSDVFHRAVNFLHDSATSGIAYPSSAYYSLLGMITVTTTALEMMRQCFLKGRRYHRIVEPRDIVILGEIALRTAVRLVGPYSQEAGQLSGILRLELLPAMKEAATAMRVSDEKGSKDLAACCAKLVEVVNGLFVE